MLFCDLSGSTALSAAMEAEDYAELLGALRQIYKDAVDREGGTLVRIQGDGMLAVFGYPEPREDDGRRAVQAALHAHAAVAALARPGSTGRPGELRLHSGVHAGMVLVQRGDLMLGTLELLGVAPNVAGRLSDAAERDEVLVSEETLGPDLHLFQSGPLRLVTVDGKGTQVPARAVTGAAVVPVNSLDARTRRGLQPFIGRQTELAHLRAALERAQQGQTQQLAIVAPPGVGKTRLARHFTALASQQGWRVLSGHCSDDLRGEPLQPLLQMLRSALGCNAEAEPQAWRQALDGLLADLGRAALAPALQQVLHVAPDGAKPPAGSEGAVAALVELFTAMASRSPLLLFVDDSQWGDDATRHVLGALGTMTAGVRLMLLNTARAIDAADAAMQSLQVVELAPFNGDEAAASIQSLLPRADPFVAAEIVHYSGGNALYIEELCHGATQAGPDQRLLRQQGAAAWLNVLVASRVARLPAPAADAVRVAAVVGAVVPAWLLHLLTGHAAGDAVVQALAEHDLLFPDGDGTLRFKHGLTRDVVYESVGLHTRRALHLRIALAFQQHALRSHEPMHEALAYHFGAAGQPAEAALHAERAGDHAAALSVLDRGKAMYHLALARLDEADPDCAEPRPWLAVADKLGLLSVFDASRRDLPVFQRGVVLARRLGDPAALARALYWLGYLHYGLGEPRQGIAACREALSVMGDDRGPLAVQLRATLGQLTAIASDYTGALPLLEEAVTVKRSHHRSSRPAVGLAFSLVCLASVVGDEGDFERAHGLLDEAWALLRGATHQIGASIQGWRSAILSWQGRWPEARDVAQESAHIAEQTHSLFQFCQGRVTAAYAQWRLDGDAAHIRVGDQATGWLEPRESGLYRSLNHGWLVDGWMACGQRDRARWHAARALRRGRTGDLIGAGMTWRALALDAAAQGHEARARQALARAAEVADRRRSAHEAASNVWAQAQAAQLLGRHADAHAWAREAAERFERLQMDWHLQQTETLR